VHPVHFAAWFRRFYGCSVGEYHRRRRFIEVRRRLMQPDLTLTQVAARPVFADQSHLTRTWKRLTGLTPSQYRTLSPVQDALTGRASVEHAALDAGRAQDARQNGATP